MNTVIEKLDADRTFFFMRGRSGLYNLLRVAGIGSGDEVILQAFTCMAVPLPILAVGAKPVYADINKTNYNLDVEDLVRKITPKTKAIIVQHTFGIPAEMDQIRKIAAERAIILIGDCCHSLGSLYKGTGIGRLTDAAFYSTEWAKPISTGIGGYLVVNNEVLLAKLRRDNDGLSEAPFMRVLLLKLQYCFSQCFLRPKMYWKIRSLYRALNRSGLIIGNFEKSEYFKEIVPDYNYRMSKWQKKILFKRYENYGKVANHRKSITDLYEKHLSDWGYAPIGAGESDVVFLRYPLFVRDKQRVLEYAKNNNIELGDWYVSPVHPLKREEWNVVGYEDGSCPNAERAAAHLINLPIHERITREECLRIITRLDGIRDEILGISIP